MLTRLLTAVAIVSAVAALAVGVLWFRAGHGHADTFHLGANSATQVTIDTGPRGFATTDSQRTGQEIGHRTDFYSFKTVLGYCSIVPCLWVAIWTRRRLLPRRPDLVAKSPRAV